LNSVSRWDFLHWLREPDSELAPFESGLSCALSANDLRERFLEAVEREPFNPSGFRRTSLEALALMEVLDGNATAVWVFSPKRIPPRLQTLPVEVAEGFLDPDPAVVRHGYYPLASRIQLLSAGSDRADEKVRRFSRFVKRATGQAVLEREGYLSLGVSGPLSRLPGRVPAIDR